MPGGDNRVVIEVLTTCGRASAVEFRMRMDTVEVWHRRHCRGVLDRDVLRAWLAEPDEALHVDEVSLSLDRMVDREGRVAITLPDVSAWTLSPSDQATLRNKT